MMECSEGQPFMDESLACGCKKNSASHYNYYYFYYYYYYYYHYYNKY